MDYLKDFVKRIPGAVYSVRKLRELLTSRSPGSLQNGDWIYEGQVLDWLRTSPARKQLPLLYRIFAAYCAYQRRLGAGRVLGGQQLHRTVISLRRLFEFKDHLELSVGPCSIFVDLNDPRMLHVPNELSEDYPDTSVLKCFLAAGDTFIDAGANHGSFSIIASKTIGPEGLLVAIEPQARKAELVEKSLAANAQCNYQVHQFACGDKSSQVDFFIPTNSSGGAGIFRRYSAVVPHEKVSVAMRRLDDMLDWAHFPGRIFLKVDVEGSEVILLRGATGMIKARTPSIMLEVNPTSMTASGKTRDGLLQCLQELGYSQYFELRPLDGPKPLNELVVGSTGSVRNVIVTMRDFLVRSIPGIALTQTEEAVGLFSILSFSLYLS
jgi:FkbM family methyltransferase